MWFMKQSKTINNDFYKQQGFTLLELIVVIIIIGILSVSILPKFQSSQGYDEYAIRSETIVKLRALQLRAMQQTANSGGCTKPNILLDQTHLGIPDINPCGASPQFSSTWEPNATGVLIESNYSVYYETSFGYNPFNFDSLGRPTLACSGGCTISIQGSERLDIQIESQGYIHAN